MILKIVCIILIFVKFSQLEYYGDISFEKYLQGISPTKNKIIIINNLLFTNKTESSIGAKSHLRQFVQNNSILHEYYSSINMSNLLAYRPSNIISQYPDRLLIFDFELSQLKLDQLKMNELLSGLSQIYLRNLNCQPFVVIFKAHIDALYKYANAANKLLHKNFRAILISKSSKGDSVVHIHPVFNGCQQNRGIFQPKSASDFAKLKVHFKKCNLNKATLNVSVSYWLPYCNIIRHRNGTIKMEFSMEYVLLKELERHYHFKANLVDGHNIWGSQTNNSWNGMMKDVIEGNSDVGMCGFTRTRDRMQTADFTTYIHLDECTFVMRKPKNANRDWLVAEPFPLDIWLPLFASFLVIIVAMYAILPKAKLVIFRLFGLLIRQSFPHLSDEKSKYARILLCTWMLSALILGHCYSSNFFSILTLPVYESTIDSFEHLEKAAKTDTHNIITWPDSALYTEIVYAPEDTRLFHALGQHFLRSKHPMINSEMGQFRFIAKNPKNIIITSRTYVNVKSERKLYNFPLHVGQENILTLYTGLVFHKRSPLRNPFNIIVFKMQEAGLFKFWSTSGKFKGSQEELAVQNVKILTRGDLLSIYILWFIGLSAALTSFIFEISIFFFFSKYKIAIWKINHLFCWKQ